MRFVQKQANDINVHYRSNSVKIIEFSDKLKKPCFLAHFGSIFPILGAKTSFLENHAQLYVGF